MLNSKTSWLLAMFLALAATVGTFSAQLQGQDADSAIKDSAEKEDADAEDGIVVPDGDAEELMEFMRELNARRPKGESRPEIIANYREIQRAMVEASTRLFAASVEDEESGLKYAALAVQMKVRSLRLLQQLGDADASKEMKAFVASLVKDKREEMSAFGRELELEVKYEFPLDADEKTVRKLAAELKKEFGEKDIDPRTAGLILQVVTRVERSGYLKLAAELNTFFAERFGKSENERVKSYSERLAGTARRLNLPGNPLELSGTLMDGSDLDWDEYRGKIVLVDYWATWCGPCIKELPNVVANYERFHEKGFDVLGICIDEDREAVEEFLEEQELPWKTMFSDDPEATGWEHPMAKKYGIGGIPTVILVDREGKVVSLEARGKELTHLLEEMLGADDKEPGDNGKSG